jgi:AraC-like DNA-binding protein
MAASPARRDERAVWRRVSPAPGVVLDLLHARMTAPYAPHVHDVFSFGACTEGREVIGYRGELYYADTGSVVILEPGEPHTGGPAEPPSFVYRAMYPAAELLAEVAGGRGTPRFREPVIADPLLAAELTRVHAALSRGTEPLETETRLAWLLGELVRRHATTQPAGLQVRRSRVAKVVMAQLADQLSCPPALAQIAAEAGLSRYQLVRSFRAEVGMPPYAWLSQHRVARARVLLEQGCRPAEAATLTGFADQAHLTRWFRRVVGVTPGAYRNSIQDSRVADR